MNLEVNHIKLNWRHVTIGIILLLFFSQTLIYTWKTASPYCRADDWRFIEIYLFPLLDDTFKIQDLWADPIHTLPVYAALFIASAEYFDLQIHYIARFAIFFQLCLGFLIIFSFVKSLKRANVDNRYSYLAIIGICSVIYSFIVNVPYTWPIMTICYLSTVFIVLICFFWDLYYSRNKILDYKYIVIISLTMVISFLLYSDWTLIFFLSIFMVTVTIFFLEKQKRKKIIILNLLLIVSALIGLMIMKFYIREDTRSFQNNISAFISLIVNHPLLTFKSLSIGLFSGIINLKWFTNNLEINTSGYMVLSMSFLLIYIYILIVFFIRKLYNKSLLPPVMMMYSLIFMFSVLSFRYNPVDNGIYCLYWPRYIQFYQVGIIGFLWSVYLIWLSHKARNKRIKTGFVILMFSLTSVLVISWINDYGRSARVSKYLRYKYQGVSHELREKFYNNHIEAPWSVQPGKDISTQLKFLYDHQLNVFAPNYPYKAVQKTDEQ